MEPELINGKFYWVKSNKESNWEIAIFEEKVKALKDNDVFLFTNSRYSHVKDCFEIDYEPIKRK